jgi:glycerophosphoryl diester phosphodiesterase
MIAAVGLPTRCFCRHDRWRAESAGYGLDGRVDLQSITPAVNNDGDTFKLLDVLARQVGIRGIFSDWPGTVTYYANCMGLVF